MNPNVQALPELMTVDQLAEYLGVAPRSVYFWRANRQGPPAFKVGKRLYFRADDVAAWLGEQSAPGATVK